MTDQITTKKLIRLTWFPATMLLFLVSWLVATDQGVLHSVPLENQAAIKRLEKSVRDLRQQIEKINRKNDTKNELGSVPTE